MTTTDAGDAALPSVTAYELVYSPIHGGVPFSFPCDDGGIVELNALGERARLNYLLARALVGRDFHRPTIVRTPAGNATSQDEP